MFVPEGEHPTPPLTSEEISLILRAILETIDVPFRKSQPAPKTILLDFFGTPNAGKTKTTEKIEQVFRRHQFNVFCPPETAEIANVRNKSTDNPIIFQARHIAGVEDYVLNLANDGRFHAVILSRGLIDLLFWYEKGVRDGRFSEIHRESVRNYIYELLRMDLVDAFVLFTCSVEAAMEREYRESVTQIRGKTMTESFMREVADAYNAVLEDVEKHVPGLPIFRIDTSNLDVKQTAQEVLRIVLPKIRDRFSVPERKYLPYSLSLINKEALSLGSFEEQLKLQGHPSEELIKKIGFVPLSSIEHEDTYLNPSPGQKESDGLFEEIVRLRKEGDKLQFQYKGKLQDRIFSHRGSKSIELSEEDAVSIRAFYPEIVVLRKTRKRFELFKSVASTETRFSIHIDTIDGIGNFTEIRARGSSSKTHTEELLGLAAELGFNLGDVVEGSYLELACKKFFLGK